MGPSRDEALELSASVSGYLVGPCSGMASAGAGHGWSHQDQDAYQTSKGG